MRYLSVPSKTRHIVSLRSSYGVVFCVDIFVGCINFEEKEGRERKGA